eukprot:6232252-Amphidinium_carterae.1
MPFGRSRRARHGDLEKHAWLALSPDTRLHWIEAHQTQQTVHDGRVTMENFRGNQDADVVANLCAAEHEAHEP